MPAALALTLSAQHALEWQLSSPDAGSLKLDALQPVLQGQSMDIRSVVGRLQEDALLQPEQMLVRWSGLHLHCMSSAQVRQCGRLQCSWHLMLPEASGC